MKKISHLSIERIFYIFGSNATVVRGQHANIKSEFVLMNIACHSKVRIKDGMDNDNVFVLDKLHTRI